MPVKPGSLRFYADLYGVSHERLRQIKSEGVDLSDDQAVKERLDLDGGATAFAPFPVVGAGLGAAITRLQEEEQALYGSYLAAKAAGSAKASVYLKQWQGVVEQLRKVEDSNPAIEREKENSISKDDLARTLGVLFSNLRLDLDSLARRVAAECERKSRLEVEAVVSRETARIVEALHSCIYLKGGAHD